ncbi:MAG TPA: hypothetical protein VGS21_09730, partial [Acidimicrobiales bacterium]|nr:hypothetical protein [Acidimicrobiales bacterium]
WLTVASSVATIGGGVATLAACAAPARKARFYGAAAACIVAVVTVPAVATATIVADRLGPFDTPFEPPAVARYVSQFFGEVPVAVESTLPTIDRARNGALYLMATETAVIASPFIYDTGQEVLPIGGFTGTTPAPTLQRIETLVERGDFHLVLQSPTPTDGRFAWISDHCISLGETKGAGALPGPTFALYYCLPRSVGSRAAARPGG